VGEAIADILTWIQVRDAFGKAAARQPGSPEASRLLNTAILLYDVPAERLGRSNSVLQKPMPLPTAPNPFGIDQAEMDEFAPMPRRS
jgi:hypothetical protein